MSKKQQQKYYVVWQGKRSGIFTSWAECSAQVTGVAGAQYKSFDTRQAAEKAYAGKYADFKGKTEPKTLSTDRTGVVLSSYSVDASCMGNPGILEYRCVNTETADEIFKQGPFQDGTNNIGEFLAIVDALALLKTQQLAIPIYSDSKIAIGWVRDKVCKTNLARTKTNDNLFMLIERAENWLRNNNYGTKILKWETETWGENPADFGRK